MAAGGRGRLPGMTDRKPRPLWPLVTAALIGLPVMYVLSIGPALWIAGESPGRRRVVARIYWPVGWYANSAPPTVTHPLIKYITIFAGYREDREGHRDFALRWVEVPIGPKAWDLFDCRD